MNGLGDDVHGQPPPAAPVVDLPPSPNAGVRARAAALRAGRVPFVLATIVRTERPTSARAGDVALVLGDGTIEGFVGGECAEASVRLQALRVLESGRPLLLRISPSTAEAEGSGTEGAVTVHNPCLSGGTLEIFLEPDLPPPVMVVHGDSPTARALRALAEHAGFVVAPAGAGATAGPLPGVAAVVVASHGRGEESVLEEAVRAGVPYVGLVASRTRGAAVLDRLGLEGEARARIHTPAGLNLGGRGPEEIAISILAEIVASRHLAETPREEAAVPPPHEGAASGKTALDPVCGMEVPALETTPAAEHEGRGYLFCGSGCREAFLADPQAYLARS